MKVPVRNTEQQTCKGCSEVTYNCYKHRRNKEDEFEWFCNDCIKKDYEKMDKKNKYE